VLCTWCSRVVVANDCVSGNKGVALAFAGGSNVCIEVVVDERKFIRIFIALVDDGKVSSGGACIIGSGLRKSSGRSSRKITLVNSLEPV